MVMVMVRQPAPLLLLSLLPLLAPYPPRRLNVTKINIFRNQKCICLFVKLQHCDTTRSLGEDLLIVCKAAMTAAVLVIICLHVSKWPSLELSKIFALICFKYVHLFSSSKAWKAVVAVRCQEFWTRRLRPEFEFFVTFSDFDYLVLSNSAFSPIL